MFAAGSSEHGSGVELFGAEKHENLGATESTDHGSTVDESVGQHA